MKSYAELFALITRRGVHQVFGEPGEGYFIEQNADELARFLVVCQELGVTSCLEVGTGWKAGLARFLHDDMGWRVTSVDVQDYGHQFGGIQFVNPEWFPYTLLGDPHGVFDLVIIDADHSYDAVKADDEHFRMRAIKLIAFHDIAGLRECEGTAQYWREIARNGDKLKPGYYELIADAPERGGIGYVVLAETKQPGRAPTKKKTPAKPTRTAAVKL